MGIDCGTQCTTDFDNGTVLFTEALELLRQPLWIGISQSGQAIDADLDQHVPALGTDAAHFAEMAFTGGVGVAHTTP